MKPYQFKTQENMSLRQRIFNDIRNAIVQGHLKPGDKLRELDISQQMSVSRGPLREALRDLEALGLVVSAPYRETTVASISRSEVSDLLIPLRLQVELFILKHHRNRMDDVFFADMENTLAQMQGATKDGDLFLLAEADLSFHEKLLMLDESSYSRQIWSGIVNRLRLHFIWNTRQFPDYGRVYNEHAELLQALKSSEVSDAALAVIWQRHIQDEDCLICFQGEEQYPQSQQGEA